MAELCQDASFNQSFNESGGNKTMCKLLFSILITLNLGQVYAEEHKFSPDVSTWKEIAVPAEEAELAVWRYSANDSEDEWIVRAEDGKVKASLAERYSPKSKGDQRFVIAEEPLSLPGKTDTASIEVEGGWLVGYNRGEFGAALYWFSSDRKKHYKISDHQIVNFFKKDRTMYAIEGLSHMGSSRGSVVRISQRTDNQRWQVSAAVKLPYAPFTAVLTNEKNLLIACDKALLVVGSDNFISVRLKPFLEDGLWPMSSALSEDEQKLYIGARQYVIEMDLQTRHLRYLVPDESFLNALPLKEQQQIRQQFGG